MIAILTLLLATALVGPAVHADEPENDARTDAGPLGGYTSFSLGSPMSVLFFEPVFPIPVDPGEPHFEATFQLSRTELSTGPRARALATSTWPGTGIGDGFPEFTEGEPWPIKADARYPDGPTEDDQETPWGAGMVATAQGLDVAARASTSESPDDDMADVGSVRSRAVSTVEDAVVRSRSVAAARDVSLLGGLIEIAEVRTVLNATSDGTTAETDGETLVSGFTIAGYGYVVDEDGMRPVEDDDGGDGLVPLPDALPGAEEMAELLGIEAHLVQPEDETEGSDARRSAEGLRIVVDNTVLREALDEHVDLFEIVDILPEEMAVHLYPLVQLSPRMEFVFGRAEVRAAASGALEFDFDVDAPPPPEEPPPAEPADGFDAPAVTDTGPGITDPGPVEEPAVAAPPEEAVALGREMPDFFGGIPPAVVALGFLLAGLGAYGLTGLSGFAMGGGAAGCERGAVRGVPGLRR